DALVGQAERPACVAGAPALIGEESGGVAYGVAFRLLGVGAGDAGLGDGFQGGGGVRVGGGEFDAYGAGLGFECADDAFDGVDLCLGPGGALGLDGDALWEVVDDDGPLCAVAGGGGGVAGVRGFVSGGFDDVGFVEDLLEVGHAG